MNHGAPVADFAEFGKRMLASQDIDPVYPVLKNIISQFGLSEGEGDWLTVLYLAYYELASAMTAFLRYPDPDVDDILGDTEVLRLPTGIERRGLRGGGPMREHLQDWLGRYDGRTFFGAAQELIEETVLYDPRAVEVTDQQAKLRPQFNNHVLDVYLRSVKYNGRWAAYKGTEVLHKVRGYDNAAPDAGHENSSGPRSGLRLFFPDVEGNSPSAIHKLNRQTDTLMAVCLEHGLELEVEQVETLLCDFNSMRKGRYYVGHDTDLMLEGALRAAKAKAALLSGRAVLDDRYRGEVRGWDGVDRELTKRYRDTGEIGDRADG